MATRGRKRWAVATRGRKRWAVATRGRKSGRKRWQWRLVSVRGGSGDSWAEAVAVATRKRKRWQWRLVGGRGWCAASSNHIIKVNRYNFIRLHNHFVHYITSKCCSCGIIDFLLLREGFQSMNVGKLNYFYSYRYSDKFNPINFFFVG